MAEKIAGITMREIDQSQPVGVRPEGIPAGVIGTAAKGPAFVPVVFANTADFIKEFGTSEGGDHFGPIAVAEWMKNSKAGLYLRTLGVGNAQKADSSTGVTSYAGFVAGSKMRDKDRTAGSGYSTLETIDEADIPVNNPYAGAAVPDQLTVAQGVAGRLPNTGVVHQSTLGIGPSPDGSSAAVTPADYDGLFIEINSGNNLVDAAYAPIKTIYFLSAQAGRTEDGTIVSDGAYVVGDFTTEAPDNIVIVDISTATTETLVRDAIKTALSAAESTSAETDDQLQIDSVGTGAVTAASVGTKHPVNTITDKLEIAVTQTGETETTVQSRTFIVTLVNGALAINDGSVFTFTSVTGASSTISIGDATHDVDLTGVTIGSDQLQDVADAFLAHADVNSVSAISGAGSLADPFLFTATMEDPVEGEALASVSVADNSPAAPEGRVHFLGVKMFASNAGGLQDYLGAALDNAGAIPVLRGVMMFPSGVVPGLAEDLTQYNEADETTEASLPSAAWGEYASSKDIGSHTGWVSGGKFKMMLNGYSGSSPKIYRASFDPKSPTYFAKMFNTDPEQIQTKGHYLHAHYDIPAGMAVTPTTPASSAYLMAGYHNINSADFSSNSADGSRWEPTYENFRQKFTHASSPWIYSQDLGTGPKKLFKIHSLDAGEIAFKDQYKIEISNVQQPSKNEYATFNLKLRQLNDTDTSPVEIGGEAWTGLSMDPSSENYIARRIGDLNTFFDFEKDSAEKQKIVTEGLYPNQSKYIRVEMNSQVQAGQMDISAMPIGFAGKDHLAIGATSLTDTAVNMIEPPLPFRQTISRSFGSNLQADSKLCWGLETMYASISSNGEYNSSKEKNAGLVSNLTKHYSSVGGNFQALVGDNRNAADIGAQIMDCDRYNNNEFSLERLWIACRKDSTNKRSVALPVDSSMWKEAVYIRNANASGYKADDTTFYQSVENGTNAADKDKSAAQGYRYLNPAIDMVNPSNANLKFFKFVVPMQGGFDGLDIFDADKKAMNDISSVREMSSNATAVLGATEGPTTAAFRKGLDILAEKADVDIQLLAIPGMKSAGISDHAIDKTEDRFDALYLMDVASFDQDDKLFQNVDGTHVSVVNTAKNLQDRNLDSSFAAAYYPEVNMADPYDQHLMVEVPASCAVLGAMAFNDAVAHPWYAPAGFTRGTLESVDSGTVIFDKDDLETLHVVDINPLTSFENSAYRGMVVWGQKTLLQGKSALDRVNVRRLLIDIRRKVRVVANSILFEPNRESTLAAFSAKVNPLLTRIQQQQGLDRFKVVIDATTTTQQDIENNTIRGKIFLQPTRSIEFISLDFVVGNQID